MPPLDPQRMARIRAHLLTAAAMATLGCRQQSDEPHVNQPVQHAVNEPEPVLQHTINNPPVQPTVNNPPPPQPTVNEPAPVLQHTVNNPPVQPHAVNAPYRPDPHHTINEPVQHT